MEPEQATAEAKALDLVILRLQRTFPDVPAEAVRAEVDRVHRDYEHSRVRGYLAILVEREVAERLRQGMIAS